MVIYLLHTELLQIEKMTTVYFVRHAQPNYDNHVDELRELTEKGLKDRRLITAFMQDKDIQVVLSSPYKRSIDTIKEFADLHDHEIQTIKGFRERKIDSVWIEDFEKIRGLMPWIVKFQF